MVFIFRKLFYLKSRIIFLFKILDAVEDADMLLLATPVYYFAMTAPLKATIDRFYSRIGK